jgi:hypothetical protein
MSRTIPQKRIFNELEFIAENCYKRSKYTTTVDSENKLDEFDGFSRGYDLESASVEQMITSSELNSPVLRSEYDNENSLTTTLCKLEASRIGRRPLSQQSDEHMLSPSRTYIQHSVDHYFSKPNLCRTAEVAHGEVSMDLSSHMNEEAFMEDLTVSPSHSLEKSALSACTAKADETAIFKNCCRCCLRKIDDSIWLQECNFCMKVSCSRCTVPCESCYEMFCNKCSTVNYQNAFERIFCMDCDKAGR